MGALRHTQKVRHLRTDGVKILYNLLQRKLQELRYLPWHAEHVLAFLEGAGQNLVSGEELIADFLQGPQWLAQAYLGVNSIVDDLHGGGAVGPVAGGVKEVGLS